MSLSLFFLFLCYNCLNNLPIDSFCEQPRRLYFLHIPKTGGTSLHTLLENQIDLKDLYPPRRFQAINEPIKHQFVSGHVPYWFFEKLDKDFESAFKITILRHPIERCLSALRYRRRNIAKFHDWDLLSLHNHERQHPRSPPDLNLTPNAMCHFLASVPDLEGRELLENAKQTLHSFDCVLFLENFEKGLEDLCQRTGIYLEKQATPHLNATTPEEVDKEFIELLKAHNDLDLELYEYAKTHLKPKNTTYQFHSPFLTSHKVKQVDYEFSMALKIGRAHV